MFEAFSILSQIHKMCGSWYLYHLADIKWNTSKSFQAKPSKAGGREKLTQRKNKRFHAGEVLGLVSQQPKLLQLQFKVPEHDLFVFVGVNQMSASRYRLMLTILPDFFGILSDWKVSWKIPRLHLLGSFCRILEVQDSNIIFPSPGYFPSIPRTGRWFWVFFSSCCCRAFATFAYIPSSRAFARRCYGILSGWGWCWACLLLSFFCGIHFQNTFSMQTFSSMYRCACRALLNVPLGATSFCLWMPVHKVGLVAVIHTVSTCRMSLSMFMSWDFICRQYSGAKAAVFLSTDPSSTLTWLLFMCAFAVALFEHHLRPSIQFKRWIS